MMYHVVRDDIHSRVAMPDVIMTFVYLVELHYLPKLVPMLTQSLVAVSGHSFVTKIDTAGFFLSTYVTTQTHEAGPKDIISPKFAKTLQLRYRSTNNFEWKSSSWPNENITLEISS